MIARAQTSARRVSPKWSVIALAIVASIGSGCVPPVATTADDDDETVPSVLAEPVAVQLVAAQSETLIRTSTQPANVHAFYRSDVRPRVGGYVTEISHDIGDPVEKDEVLAKIAVPILENEASTLAAQIELLVAGESSAEAELRLARSAVDAAEARLSQAKSQVTSADASVAAAEAEFRRTEDLVSRGTLQNRLLDESRKRRDTESALQQSLRSAVDSASADVEVARAEVASAEAKLQMARAETEVARRRLSTLQTRLDFSTVRASLSGIVTRRMVELGDLVHGDAATSAEPMFEVSQVTPVRVRVSLPERDAAIVRRGDPMTLTFPSFASEPPMQTSVDRISGGLDATTRTMIVEAVVANADRKLLPGMFGQATIELGGPTTAQTLPSRAVRFDESGSAYVYIIDDDMRVSRRDVSVGADDGSRIEIRGGIGAGQLVIDSHLRRFRDGDLVRPL